MAEQPIILNNELYQYLCAHQADEPVIVQQLRERTQRMSMGHMQTFPEVAHFLKLICKLTKPKSILEIGTFTGLSSMVMALATEDDAQIETIDMNEAWTNIAKKFWQKADLDHKIHFTLSAAKPRIEQLLKEGHKYDLIFIDADKKRYCYYYEACLELLKQDGLMIIDNTLFGGSVINPEIDNEQTVEIRALNKKLKEDTRIDLAFLPLGDGLSLITKKSL